MQWGASRAPRVGQQMASKSDRPLLQPESGDAPGLGWSSGKGVPTTPDHGATLKTQGDSTKTTLSPRAGPGTNTQPEPSPLPPWLHVQADEFK